MAKGKITLQMLSEMMANNNGRSKSSAETFVRAFFTTLKDALQRDNLVKIKGFGTFKLVVVSARESVNVNTGERVNIAGYNKITFTPDKTLKDRINRPFSQFDTIVLDDDDINLIEGKEPKASAESVGAPVVASVMTPVQEEATTTLTEHKEIVDTPAESVNLTAPTQPDENATLQQNETMASQPVLDETVTSQPIVDETVASQPVVDDAEDSKPVIDEIKPLTESGTEGQPKKSKRGMVIAIIILVAVLVAVGLFCLGRYSSSSSAVKDGTADSIMSVKDSIEQAALKAERDSVMMLRAEAEKYEQVEDGEYVITGLLACRKVRGGLTLQRMCRRMYEADGYMPYVLKFNNMKDPSEAWGGRIIKFPKLEKRERLYSEINK